ncbi:MAG: SpoIIE family protein phosphatase [bacterium]|nr:SpoIIE family protein phosphatase [bacterium]
MGTTVPFFSFLALLSTAVSTFLAFFVYRKNPKKKANQIFLVLMVCFIFWALLELKIICTQGTKQLFWIRAMLATVLFLAPAFYHFTFAFPREDDRLLRYGKVFLLIYVPSVILTVLLLLPPGTLPVFSSFQTAIQLFDWGFSVPNHFVLKLLRAYFISFMILVLINLRIKLSSAEEKKEKIQLNYIISALLFPLTIGSVVLLIFKYMLVGRGYENLTYYIFGLFPTISIIMSMVLAYSIARYNLMGIRIIINKTLLYTLITGSLATIYVAVEELVETLFQRLLPNDISFYGIIAALVVALISAPLHQHMSRIIDNLFARKKRNRHDLLKQAVEKLGTTLDKNLLQEIILEIMTGWLGIERADLYLEGKAGEFKLCSARGLAGDLPARRTWKLKDESHALLLKTGQPFVLTGSDQDDSPASRGLELFCRRYGYGIICSFIINNSITGLVGLGGKLNGEPYNQDDIGLLSVLSRQAALRMENVQLNEKVSSYEQFEKEYVVARSLHSRFIPDSSPSIPDYSIAFSCLPSPDIRGNFLDFIHFGPGRTGIVLGDVPGRGVEATTRVALVYGLVKGEIKEDRKPGTILESLNTVLVDMEARETVFPIFYGILDYHRHLFSFCNAHDTQPYLIRKDQAIPLERNGELPGLRKESSYQTGEITFETGDTLLLYSKGVPSIQSVISQLQGDSVTNERLTALIGSESTTTDCCVIEDKTIIVIRRV